MVSRGDMLSREDVLEILAIPLVGLVPDHEDIITSANRGMPVAYDDRSVAGAAFRRIAMRTVGEEVPIPDFTDNQGFWSVFKRWMGLEATREIA
jgi:septum site-determining protein MinD